MKMLKTICCAVALMGALYMVMPFNTQAQSALPSQKDELIPRRYLFGNPEKVSPKLSPDGTQLAYLAPDENNVLNVWIRDLQKKIADRKVTSDQKRGVRDYSWQLDSGHILYIQDKDGDENHHLYQTDILTHETKDLTPYEGVKVSLLAADPAYPETLLIQMNRRNPSLFDVFRLNLQSGKLDLDTENPGGVIDWAADHQLQVRASQSYTADGSNLIRIRDNGSAPWRDFLVLDPLEIVDLQGFSADNAALYVMTSLDANTSRLLKIDTASGEKVVMAEDPAYDLSTILLHPITHSLEAVGVNREKHEWVVLDPKTKSDFDFLRDRFNGPFTLASRDLADQNWILASQSDQRPVHYYLYHRASHGLDFLFSTQPTLEKYRLSPMQPISFQAKDGMQLHGYLTVPVGKDVHNLPVIVLVHGGPWVRDSWGLQPQVQWLANRGYAVLQINYRGSTGYGKAYLNAGDKEWGNKMHRDLLDGKEWLIRQGIADPDRVAIFGGSYGGYATLVGLAFTPDEFCCGVDIVGPSNLITLLQTIPPYWSPLKASMDRQIGSLEKDEQLLKSRSPLFKADQIKKPLLIGQGANDPRVKQAESDQIVSVMRHNKLYVEYLLFPDEGHGFVRPENRLKFYSAAEDFLSKYLGGKSEKPSSEENWDSLKR